MRVYEQTQFRKFIILDVNLQSYNSWWEVLKKVLETTTKPRDKLINDIAKVLAAAKKKHLGAEKKSSKKRPAGKKPQAKTPKKKKAKVWKLNIAKELIMKFVPRGFLQNFKSFSKDRQIAIIISRQSINCILASAQTGTS